MKHDTINKFMDELSLIPQNTLLSNLQLRLDVNSNQQDHWTQTVIRTVDVSFLKYVFFKASL